jgi:hypothetical protein
VAPDSGRFESQRELKICGHDVDADPVKNGSAVRSAFLFPAPDTPVGDELFHGLCEEQILA